MTPARLNGLCGSVSPHKAINPYYKFQSWLLRTKACLCKFLKKSDQKALSPGLLISYCIKKKKVQGSLCSCHVFFKLACYPVKVAASCGSILLACFALNSVEAQECMPLQTFLDEKRRNMLVTFSFLLW